MGGRDGCGEEAGHRLLEGTVGMAAPGEAGRPGMEDVALGGQAAGDGESDIPRPADQVIDAVIDGLVVDETVQGGRVAELRVSIYFAGRGSEADPPQQVLSQ